MHRIVILGTGTHIGKTYFTAELTRVLAAHPHLAGAFAVKPIESGVPDAIDRTAHLDPASAPDGSSAQRAPIDRRITPGDQSDASQLNAVSTPHGNLPPRPYAFAPPISPHLAARLANRPISIELVTTWVTELEHRILQGQPATPSAPEPVGQKTNIRAPEPCILIETAGAVFSPLGLDTTNFTMARALDPAIWILVAPDRLGVLHDLTVTLSTMATHGRIPDHVVVNQCPPTDASTGTNAAELLHLRIAEKIEVVTTAGPVPPSIVHQILTALEKSAP